MKRIFVLPGILLMTLASGCACPCLYELRNEITDCKINYCNRQMAKASYCEIEAECMGLDCPYSFREGYLTGYISVCNGNNGCLPPVAFVSCFNHMWLDCGAVECEKLEAWFDGFEHGAMAAKAEGMTDVNIIVNRITLATPMDYWGRSSSGHGAPSPTSAPAPQEVPDMEVPPTPKADADDTEPAVPPAPQMPQTRRIPSSIFK